MKKSNNKTFQINSVSEQASFTDEKEDELQKQAFTITNPVI